MPPNFKLKCLHCNTGDSAEFHKIFDELGVELQLDVLLQQHFQLWVTHNPAETQVLCEECVNKLIELYDDSEREKDQSETKPFDNNITDHSLLNKSDEDQPELGIPSDEFEEFVDSNEKGNNNALDADKYEEISEGGTEKEQLFITNSAVNLDVFDYVDLQTYADAVINTNLEEIQLKRQIECNICIEKFEYHQDLLAHIKLLHVAENKHFICPFLDCGELLENEKILARHVILRHYDLSGISIFGACPDCEMTFSNFLDFNKHSCCRTLKNRAEIVNYCKYCEKGFPSFRKYRFHLQFHMAIKRPKICLLCDQTFCNVDKFFEHVHYEHEPAGRLICVKCDRIFNNTSLYEAHLTKHNLPKKFVCTHCPKSFTYNFKLKRHMETHNDDGEPFKCEICSKDFASKTYYSQHLKLHEPFADVQVNVCSVCGLIGRDKDELLEHQEKPDSKCSESQIEEEIISDVFVCEYCELFFKTRSDLKAHRATGIHMDKIFHCPFCILKLNELRKLRVHLKTHKLYEKNKSSFPLVRQYMCDVGDCEYVRTTWMSLNRHKIGKHKELHLICEKCNKRFNKRGDFDIHISKCQKDGVFNCQFCEKQCPSKMSLSVHIARSHNNKNVKCSTCNASFKDDKNLQKHIELEHEEMICNLCDKKIKNKRNLLLHQRIVHFNDKRFFCEICNKGFFNKSDMEAHKKTVHPSTSYKCSECLFETNYEKSMDIHIAWHNNNFKFQCTICLKEFTRESVMKLHMKRHESKREFVCKNCDASFITRWLLNRHMKNKHTQDEKNTNDVPARRKRQKKYKSEEETAEIDDPIMLDPSDQDVETYVVLEDESNRYLFDYNVDQETSNLQTQEDVIMECKIFP